MSYTKNLGNGRYNRSKKLIMFKGNKCDNCKYENETTMLAFDNSDCEYSSVILCKDCIINFIDCYNELKHNKRCYYCEDYFEELISKEITHDTPGGIKIKKFEFCKECDRLHKEQDSVLDFFGDVHLEEKSKVVSYAEMIKRNI